MKSPSRLNLWISLGLIAVTLAIYWPVRTHGFVGLDDEDYVTENIHVRNGFTPSNVAWAFTSVRYAVNWHPLTWLSHMLDCQIFGLHAGGPHLVNVAIHAASAVILFLLLTTMTSAPWRSGFVAALFALHPLHVESVAWISERKDVLSGLFWMLTMAAYVSYTRRTTAWRYALVIFVFALGLMAKPMLVTLPCVLLLLDWWPLSRIRRFATANPSYGGSEVGSRRSEGKWRSKAQEAKGKGEGIRRSEVTRRKTEGAKPGSLLAAPKLGEGGPHFRFPLSAFRFAADSRGNLPALILEKIPMLFLSGIASFLVIHAQGTLAIVPVSLLPMSTRLMHSVAALMIYLEKTVWPVNLAIYYPYSSVWPQWTVIPSAIGLAALTALFVWQAKGRPWLIVGWLWFVGTMIPVIGLVQVGAQGRADRYTYIPLIGLFIAVTWEAVELARRNKIFERVLAGIAIITIAACAFVTERQIGYWSDDLTLFSRTAASAINNAYAQDLGATALAKQGFMSEAIRHWQIAFEMGPGLGSAHTNMANALAKHDRLVEAIEQYKRALELGPDDFEAQIELARIYATRQGYLDPKSAVQLAEQGCRTAGYDWPDYLDVLGAAYASADRFDEAIAVATKAARIAREAGERELPARIESHLVVYRQGKPFFSDNETTPWTP